MAVPPLLSLTITTVWQGSGGGPPLQFQRSRGQPLLADRFVDRIIVAVAPTILGAGTQAEAHARGNAMDVEVHRLAHAGAVGQ